MTDGQTDRILIAIPRLHYMQRVKNCCHQMSDVRLKCTKIDFGSSSPDPAGGAYSAPPDPIAGFKGAYFYEEGEEREGVEREERGGEGKKWREKEGRGREWRIKTCCPMSNKLSPPMVATLTFRALHSTGQPYMTSQFTRVANMPNRRKQ